MEAYSCSSESLFTAGHHPGQGMTCYGNAKNEMDTFCLQMLRNRTSWFVGETLVERCILKFLNGNFQASSVEDSPGVIVSLHCWGWFLFRTEKDGCSKDVVTFVSLTNGIRKMQ